MIYYLSCEYVPGLLKSFAVPRRNKMSMFLQILYITCKSLVNQLVNQLVNHLYIFRFTSTCTSDLQVVLLFHPLSEDEIRDVHLYINLYIWGFTSRFTSDLQVDLQVMYKWFTSWCTDSECRNTGSSFVCLYRASIESVSATIGNVSTTSIQNARFSSSDTMMKSPSSFAITVFNATQTPNSKISYNTWTHSLFTVFQ